MRGRLIGSDLMGRVPASRGPPVYRFSSCSHHHPSMSSRTLPPDVSSASQREPTNYTSWICKCSHQRACVAHICSGWRYSIPNCLHSLFAAFIRRELQTLLALLYIMIVSSQGSHLEEVDHRDHVHLTSYCSGDYVIARILAQNLPLYV